MPVGKDFFTGNSATVNSQSSLGRQSSAIGVGSSSRVGVSSGGGGSTSSAVDMKKGGGEMFGGMADSSEQQQQLKQHQYSGHNTDNDEFDSDVEDCPKEDPNAEEDWPPPKYSAAAPLSLPFGPKSQAMRERLADAVRRRFAAKVLKLLIICGGFSFRCLLCVG